jgi:autoinducer 2 (AI-2) kinase
VSGDELVLAVDAGTGSCRAGVFDLSGRLLGLGAREWRHPVPSAHPDARDFDTTAAWELVSASVRAALSRAGVARSRVRALATSSMRGGLVAHAPDGGVLWACSNADARAADEARTLVESGGAAELQRRGGDGVAMGAAPRLQWLLRHEPELFARAERFSLINDWLVGALTGEVVTDPSIGSSSGLFDLPRRTWAPESLGLCGLDLRAVPAVVDAGTPVGRLSASAAAALQLDRDVTVVMGGADTALALVGLGLTTPGAASSVCGTFWQQSLSVDRCVIDPRGEMRSLCHALPGQWLVEAIVFYAGLALRWFRDGFCDLERERAAELGVDPYALMEDLAESVPAGAGGVMALLSNSMDVRRWVHAAPTFVGFDLEAPERSGKKECIRAIMESASFVLSEHVRGLERVGGTRLPELVLAGGAARGRVWPQIVADVSGRRLRVPSVAEATLRGGALFAASGAGLIKDVRAVATPAEADRVVSPQPELRAVYASIEERRRAIYDAQLDLAERGLTRPLWWAPGTSGGPAGASGGSASPGGQPSA